MSELLREGWAGVVARLQASGKDFAFVFVIIFAVEFFPSPLLPLPHLIFPSLPTFHPRNKTVTAAGYWSKNRNRFDGVITLGGVLTELVSRSTDPSKSSEVSGRRGSSVVQARTPTR